LFLNKIVNQAWNFTVARLSVNEEFRNEIAKPTPFFARTASPVRQITPGFSNLIRNPGNHETAVSTLRFSCIPGFLIDSFSRLRGLNHTRPQPVEA
jgi:hypothetical protein